MGEKSWAISSLISMEFLEEDDKCLSYWQFINRSDADSDDDSILKGFGSWHSSVISEPIEGFDDHHSTQNEVIKPVDVHYVDCDLEIGYYNGVSGDDEEKSDVDDEEESDGDLDDELVPWSVSNKLGRQRMRKLGKRGFAKMNSSKRLPYLFVRPGCVHGKHGLGLKHNNY